MTSPPRSRVAELVDTGSWHGWTLRQVRDFVDRTAKASDDTLVIAVTKQGTQPLLGAGFFTVSDGGS